MNVFLSFHPQFRNQYDNDVTVWSPQVRCHSLCSLPSDCLRSLSAPFTRPRCDTQSNCFLFVLIQGRIHQIEYAMEAVKQGSATVGLKSRTHAVLVALKVRTARILREKSKSLDSAKQINALCEIHWEFKPFIAFSVLFLQRAQSELAAHQKKILHVDNHIGISIAGLTADARLLWSVTAAPFSFAANSLKVP